MIDTNGEFATAIAAATRAAFDWLERKGVAREVLWHGAQRFGLAEIVPSNDGFYQPVDGGQRVIVMPVLPIAAPWDDDFSVEDVGDLIAWRPEDSGRWWRRTGLLPIMNPAAIETARYSGKLRVYSSPLAWLRAGGDGVVILDPAANLHLWFGDVPEIVADTVDLGREINRRLAEPIARVTRVLVPNQRDAA